MHSLGIVQWNSTRRDHPGNLRGVSESGPVNLGKANVVADALSRKSRGALASIAS